MDAALDPQRADEVLNTLEGQQQQINANTWTDAKRQWRRLTEIRP